MKYINKIVYKNCIGKVFASKYYGLFKVISYHNRSKVEIEFIETGYRKFCGLSNIRICEIKDPYFKSLCGVGVVGVKYDTRYKNESGKSAMVKQYNIWSHMKKDVTLRKAKTRIKHTKTALFQKTLNTTNTSMNGVTSRLGSITKVGT